MKVACTVWSGGKGGDNFKALPIAIKISYVRNALLNGKIIEQYPNDYPYTSCLILVFLNSETPIHVCIGLGDYKLWVITAYYLGINEWESDFKTKKAVN